MTELALSVKDLRVNYGGIAAVKGISFDVNRGEIVSLIGANGAGKSSTLKAIVRLVNPAGSVRVFGQDVGRLETHHIAALGVSLVPEGRAIFPAMTVLENLEMGAFLRREKDGMSSRMAEVVSLFPRLGERMKQEAGTLSGGEQQMLAIGRAMMAAPRILLLDEPSLGLAPKLTQEIFAAIRKIAAAGMTILLVEQNTKLALDTAKRAYVMVTGEVAFEGESAVLREDERVRAAYLGG